MQESELSRAGTHQQKPHQDPIPVLGQENLNCEIYLQGLGQIRTVNMGEESPLGPGGRRGKILWPQGKLANQSPTTGDHGKRTQLQPTLAIMPHLRGEKKTWETLVKCTVQRHRPLKDWDLIRGLPNTSHTHTHLTTTPLLKVYVQLFLLPSISCPAIKTKTTRQTKRLLALSVSVHSSIKRG